MRREYVTDTFRVGTFILNPSEPRDFEVSFAFSLCFSRINFAKIHKHQLVTFIKVVTTGKISKLRTSHLRDLPWITKIKTNHISNQTILTFF